MARVGRIAGAILAETGGDWYLIGNTKEPCDFAAAGFEPPAVIDAPTRRFSKLAPAGRPELPAPWWRLDLEGEPLAELLADRLLIERNGSVSERLWRQISNPRGDGAPPPAITDVRWLAEIPREIWNIVRECVLRCS